MNNVEPFIITEEFKLSSSNHSRFVIKRIITKLWWIFLLPIVFIIIAGVYLNYYWYFLLPLFMCIIYPLLLFFSFVKIGYTREAGESLYTHRFIFTPRELIYEPSVISLTSNDGKNNIPNLKSHSYKIDDLKVKEYHGQYIILVFSDNGSEFVMIPTRVLPKKIPQEIKDIWLPTF